MIRYYIEFKSVKMPVITRSQSRNIVNNNQNEVIKEIKKYTEMTDADDLEQIKKLEEVIIKTNCLKELTLLMKNVPAAEGRENKLKELLKLFKKINSDLFILFKLKDYGIARLVSTIIDKIDIFKKSYYTQMCWADVADNMLKHNVMFELDVCLKKMSHFIYPYDGYVDEVSILELKTKIGAILYMDIIEAK